MWYMCLTTRVLLQENISKMKIIRQPHVKEEERKEVIVRNSRSLK
jgi:hypothetical protein